MKLSPKDYFKKYGNFAVIDSLFSGVPASITLSQSALESGWAGSTLTREANNFFGIKAGGGWTGPTYNINTQEFTGGQYITKADDFRKYASPYQSFKDHSKFLKENQRYSNLFALNKYDYVNWAKGLKASGYATAPDYDKKLINLIEQHQLYKYDQKTKYFKIIGIAFLFIVVMFVVKKYIIDKK